MAARSILFVNRVYPPDAGATGRLLADVACHMADQGWQVTVVAEGEGDATPMPGLTVRRTGGRVSGASARAYLGSLGRLARLALAQPRHDLVVTMTDPPLLHLAGPALRARHRAALVHWCQDLYPDLFPRVGLALPKAAALALAGLSTAALARCDRLVPIGDCMADRLAARGLDPRRIHPIPNWPQAGLLAAKPDRGALEEIVPAARGRLVLLYAGTIGLVHPTAPLLHAARRLQAAGAPVQIVVMGAGRRRQALDQDAASLRNLSLLPYLDDGRAAMVSATADLHLALMEPATVGMLVPCKVPAALGAGRPVLFCGPPDGTAARQVAASGAGRVVPPDGEALAAAVQACLEHPGMLEAWTEAAARERAAFRDRPGPAAFAGLASELLEGRVARPRLIRRLSLPVTTPLGPGRVG
ncbi:glycosyltransferase family 4 protein [Aerophototrophica crusticola]|uniref:Glycosyltransferase family 4 protein n=1 Tax=Aerophototrophica crusticola TaxID=1709002 RepID=A0A858R482_9PROT|nr:glycosyltransferase family 4 protein [Rhodospirillaceae bacterium B3]